MFNLPFDSNRPIVGKASVIINKKIDEVFEFVGENFFENYPKWSSDVIEFEPLDGHEVVVGARARQLRKDQGKEVSSTFQVDAYQPLTLLRLKGVSDDYRDCYSLEKDEDGWTTKLTYSFELLNIDIFMRPFEKLIRVAIEDGAETTTENINKLLSA